MNLSFGRTNAAPTLQRSNLTTQLISTVRPTVHTNLSGKRSFISTVRPTVHTSLSPKRSFSKTLFKPEEFENVGFAFSRGRKTF